MRGPLTTAPPSTALRLQAAFLLACAICSCEKTPPVPSAGPSPLGREIEQLTGAHTRLVWSQNQKRQSADSYSSGGGQLLLALDSCEPGGPRALVRERGNYSRPVLSADGGTILYTRKETTEAGRGRRQLHAAIFAMPWSGGPARPLGEGYAVDVWRDPATGVQWVCAVREFAATDRPVTEGRLLVRFPLDDPSRVETLWDRTPLDPDNIQLSADGSQACAGAPWPDVSRLDLRARASTRLAQGCWPGLAPDDSGLMWAFAEDHRRVQLFDGKNQPAGALDLAAACGHPGGAVFHPRWSNHPAVITFTGPYLDEAGRATSVARGGLSAEVRLARLTPDGKAIAKCLRITNNALGDNFPDVWIEGGR